MTQQLFRNGLDLSTVKKKPLIQLQHSIPIDIRRYFTDVDGAIVAKNTVAAALQTEYPFFLLGDFDRQGGYNASFKNLPVRPGTFYVMSFVNGYGMTSQQITGFTGLNNVQERMNVGDLVHVYTDSLIAPNNFIWIVQQNRNGSIASIIGNTETSQQDGTHGKMFVDHFQYYSDNQAEQWNRALMFTRSNNIGAYAGQQVQPYIFRNPYTEQDGFIKVECKFNMDQYQSIGIPFLFNTEQIQANFCIIQNS